MGEPTLLRSVEVGGERCDVRLAGGRVAEVGQALAHAPGEEVVEGAGGALLPGLADHHLHLAATAAAMDSVDAAGRTASSLAAAIGLAVDDVVRVVGWHESEPLGHLDADRLEHIAPGRAVRVQHRSGAMWVLSRTLLARLPAGRPAGLELAPDGRPTGRLLGGDRWLGDVLGTRPPDFERLARQLLGHGLTHLTDATPEHDPDLAATIRGQLPQHVSFMGLPGGAPHKILLPEHELPPLGVLTDLISRQHDGGRPVAIHTVTRVSLLLALAALADAGVCEGDRLEHAAVVPPEVRAAMRGLTVVTQPAIATTRGDVHREAVDAADLPHLWPVRTLRRAGIRVGLSSDAPHGPLDPWQVMRAARDRLTPAGKPANPAERITAAEALAAMTTPPADPGGRPRAVVAGAPADLVLCHVPLAEVLDVLATEVVRGVFLAGRRLG